MQIQMVSLGKEGGGVGWKAGFGWICGVGGDWLGLWGGVGGRGLVGFVGWEREISVAWGGRGGISWVCEMGERLLVEWGERSGWIKVYSFHW